MEARYSPQIGNKAYYIISFRISNGEKIFSEDISKGEKAELLLL